VHVKAVHLKEKEEVCNICDFKTALKGNLDRHITTVHSAVKVLIAHSVILSQHQQNTLIITLQIFMKNVDIAGVHI
jgi:hypothetical protein